ncbi:STAS domain-containing protein [Synechococcus lacustris]|nr:STAS domain-containing protein [Synechococcus lacustris]
MIPKRPLDLIFKPLANGIKDKILHVSPDIPPKDSIEITACEINGSNYANFNSKHSFVTLPKSNERLNAKVTETPSQETQHMELNKSIIKGWQVIEVKGQIDSKTVGDLRDYLDQNITGDLPVALDLTEVPFMSSAGLRTLLTLNRKTQDMNIKLCLVGVIEEISETMNVTGFLKYFTMHHNIADLSEESKEND